MEISGSDALAESLKVEDVESDGGNNPDSSVDSIMVLPRIIDVTIATSPINLVRLSMAPKRAVPEKPTQCVVLTTTPLENNASVKQENNARSVDESQKAKTKPKQGSTRPNLQTQVSHPPLATHSNHQQNNQHIHTHSAHSVHQMHQHIQTHQHHNNQHNHNNHQHTVHHQHAHQNHQNQVNKNKNSNQQNSQKPNSHMNQNNKSQIKVKYKVNYINFWRK